jgi:uncharacterized protein (UPF0333 family)
MKRKKLTKSEKEDRVLTAAINAHDYVYDKIINDSGDVSHATLAAQKAFQKAGDNAVEKYF